MPACIAQPWTSTRSGPLPSTSIRIGHRARVGEDVEQGFKVGFRMQRRERDAQPRRARRHGRRPDRRHEEAALGKALREIMRIADFANEHFDKHKPWELAKDAAQRPLLQAVCSDVLRCFRALTIYLAPVLPATAERVAVNQQV